MKSFTKFIGIIVIAAVTTFSFVSCLEEEEKVIINTNGRLTITGLNSYIGHEIWGIHFISNDPLILGAYNESYSYFTEGSNVDYLKVTGDSATLKVYRFNDGSHSDYSGNDKNVQFSLYSDKLGWVGDSQYRFGTVTVDFFINGVGSGVFVPAY